MSRCFGFPPPGYSRKCSVNENDNEALILSIKLQRENEKAISDRERERARSSSDRKEKKREKKERRQHKEKHKKSHHGVDGSVKEKQVASLYEVDKYRTLPENKIGARLIECEQLEKSSVTEEHGQPIDIQKASCSSDSTGDSSKRKRTTPPSSIQSYGSGNILRIRLPSLKKEDQSSTSGCSGQGTSVPLHHSEERKTTSLRNIQPCSSIWREEPSVKPKDVKHSLDSYKNKLNLATASSSGAALHSVSRHDQKLLRLSAPPLAVAAEPAPPLLVTPVPVPTPALEEEKLSSHEKKILKREAKYAKLFGSWVPPAIKDKLTIDDDSDEDWLFGSKSDEKPGKRWKVNDSEMNQESYVPCASAVLQPRASYLSDFSIYAMPFTLPF